MARSGPRPSMACSFYVHLFMARSSPRPSLACSFCVHLRRELAVQWWHRSWITW
jgi:hypothetical protein